MKTRALANRRKSDASLPARLTLIVDGRRVDAFPGDTIASALIRSGHLGSRTIDGNPLGVYCNIGVCHSCVMTVNGQSNVRICQTPASDGCRVESQHFRKGAADD